MTLLASSPSSLLKHVVFCLCVWAAPLGHMPRRSVGRHIVPSVLVADGEVDGEVDDEMGGSC